MNVDEKIQVSGVPDNFVVIPRFLAIQMLTHYANRLVALEIDGVTERSRNLRAIVETLESATGKKASVRM